jgi:hypothetical protein
MQMMGMCGKCKTITAGLFLLVGLAYLLADLGMFSFGVSWWTSLFVVWGVTGLASSKCSECKKC